MLISSMLSWYFDTSDDTGAFTGHASRHAFRFSGWWYCWYRNIAIFARNRMMRVAFLSLAIAGTRAMQPCRQYWVTDITLSFRAADEHFYIRRIISPMAADDISLIFDDDFAVDISDDAWECSLLMIEFDINNIILIFAGEYWFTAFHDTLGLPSGAHHRAFAAYFIL